VNAAAHVRPAPPFQLTGTDESPTPASAAAPRAQLLSALLCAPVLSFPDDVSVLLDDLPPSTLEKLRAQGTGPPVFVIGRRRFVLQSKFRAWLEQIATEAA
jgi:hypothetical protein